MLTEIGKRRHMILGNNHYVDWPVGASVVKREDVVCFQNDFNWCGPWNRFFAIEVTH